MFKFIKNMIRKHREKQDAAYLHSIRDKIGYADDDTLSEMDRDLHYGMESDRKIGHTEPYPAVVEASEIIKAEMKRRGLKTCEELEEEIWFSQRGN